MLLERLKDTIQRGVQLPKTAQIHTKEISNSETKHSASLHRQNTGACTIALIREIDFVLMFFSLAVLYESFISTSDIVQIDNNSGYDHKQYIS